MAKSFLVPDTACAVTATACITSASEGQYAWFQAAAGAAASVKVFNSDDNYAAKLIWTFISTTSHLTSPMMGPYKLRAGSGVYVHIAGTSASAVIYTAS